MRKLVLAVILALCVTAFLVAAAVLYTLNLQASVNIVSEGDGGTTAEIKAYASSSCLEELTVLDIGEIPAGGIRTVYFYVKNLGNVDLSLSVRSDLDPAVGSFAYTCFGSTVSPGGVSMIGIQFTANADASPGTYGFTIYVDAAA